MSWTKAARIQYQRSGLRYTSDLSDTESALIARMMPPTAIGPTAGGQSARDRAGDVARRSGWEGAAIWMASQCRGEVMIAAQIVVRKSFVEL
ncbi:transposase [Bradyrhizobium sp. F1.13.1]